MQSKREKKKKDKNTLSLVKVVNIWTGFEQNVNRAAQELLNKNPLNKNVQWIIDDCFAYNMV